MSRNNEPAFPALDSSCGELSLRYTGMTLCDYFAAKAMQGDWAAQSESEGSFINDIDDHVLRQRAAIYYRMADAMLAARGEGEKA